MNWHRSNLKRIEEGGRKEARSYYYYIPPDRDFTWYIYFFSASKPIVERRKRESHIGCAASDVARGEEKSNLVARSAGISIINEAHSPPPPAFSKGEEEDLSFLFLSVPSGGREAGECQQRRDRHDPVSSRATAKLDTDPTGRSTGAASFIFFSVELVKTNLVIV